MQEQTTTEVERQTEERLSRARNEDMESYTISDDPVVVQVDNQSNNTVHTVVPEALHCSCEDHTYRGAMCKHLIFLADQSDRLAETVRQEITDELRDLQDEEMDLRARLTDIAERRTEFSTVRENLEVVLDYSDNESSESDSDESESNLNGGTINEEAQEFSDLSEGNGRFSAQPPEEVGTLLEEMESEFGNEQNGEPEEHSEFRQMVDELQGETQ